MAQTLGLRFLLPTRRLPFVFSSYSSATFSRRTPSLLHYGRAFGELQPSKTWMNGFQTAMRNQASNSRWKSCIQRFNARYICSRACRFGFSSVCGISVVLGSMGLWSQIAHSMDGLDVLVDDHHADLSRNSNAGETQPVFLTYARKLLAPIFLFITILMNWKSPTILAFKIILIFLSTRPRPSSVNLFIEQLRHNSMRDHPFLHMFKSSYAKRVEVEDYLFLCLVTVEFEDKKLTVVGILGGWWVLPRPQYEKPFTLFPTRSGKSRIFQF